MKQIEETLMSQTKIEFQKPQKQLQYSLPLPEQQESENTHIKFQGNSNYKENFTQMKINQRVFTQKYPERNQLVDMPLQRLTTYRKNFLPQQQLQTKFSEKLIQTIAKQRNCPQNFTPYGKYLPFLQKPHQMQIGSETGSFPKNLFQTKQTENKSIMDAIVKGIQINNAREINIKQTALCPGKMNVSSEDQIKSQVLQQLQDILQQKQFHQCKQL